jgi:hypothetical protein
LPGNLLVGELTFRHWSNGGVRLPNHGQDFVTLTVRVNSGLVGTERSERIADYKGVQAIDKANAANLP